MGAAGESAMSLAWVSGSEGARRGLGGSDTAAMNGPAGGASATPVFARGLSIDYLGSIGSQHGVWCFKGGNR